MTLPLYCPSHPARRGTIAPKDGCIQCATLHTLNSAAKNLSETKHLTDGEYSFDHNGLRAEGGYEHGYYDEIDTTPVHLDLDTMIRLGESAKQFKALIIEGLDRGLQNRA